MGSLLTWPCMHTAHPPAVALPGLLMHATTSCCRPFPACSEKGKKLVELDVALAMWDLLLPSSRWQHVEAWKEFMRTHHKRPVSRDTWNQLLEFVLVRADWRRLLRSLAAVPVQALGRHRCWAMWAGSTAGHPELLAVTLSCRLSPFPSPNLSLMLPPALFRPLRQTSPTSMTAERGPT